jgi:hypothetical protein
MEIFHVLNGSSIVTVPTPEVMFMENLIQPLFYQRVPGIPVFRNIYIYIYIYIYVQCLLSY